MARLGLRPGALVTWLTGPTTLRRAVAPEDRLVPPVAPCAPRGAGFAPWPGDPRCLPRPVEAPEISGGLALRRPCALGGHRAHARQVEVSRPLPQSRRGHTASSDARCIRATLGGVQRWLEGLGPGHSRDGGLGRRAARHHTEGRLLTGLGHRHCVSRPGQAPVIPPGRVRGIGRVQPQPGWGESRCVAPAPVALPSSGVPGDPGLSGAGHAGERASPAGSRCMRERAAPLEASGATRFGRGLALGCARGATGFLAAWASARKPAGCHLWAQPRRGHARRLMARGAERFPHTCHAMARPARGHARGGAGARPSPGLRHATGVQPGAQALEAPLCRAPGHQAGPALGEGRVVAARLGALPPPGILPVKTPAHGVRRLTIGQRGRTRQDGDESEAPRRFRRWPARRREGSTGRRSRERPPLIPPGPPAGRAGEGGLGYAPRVRGRGAPGTWGQGHHVRPAAREEGDGLVVTRKGA
jgi:hypothetical protein